LLHVEPRREELVHEATVLRVGAIRLDVGHGAEPHDQVDVPGLLRLGVGGEPRRHADHTGHRGKDRQRPVDDLATVPCRRVLRLELQQVNALDHGPSFAPPAADVTPSRGTTPVMAWKRRLTRRIVAGAANADLFVSGGTIPARARNSTPASTRMT